MSKCHIIGNHMSRLNYHYYIVDVPEILVFKKSLIFQNYLQTSFQTLLVFKEEEIP